MKSSDILNNLNDAQKKAVQDTEGHVLVFAGAGSGKTRVLTSRIAYLVKEKDVSPKNILAITFTNKAAKEMKDRLSKYFSLEDTWVCTIHSMCTKILKRNASLLGYTNNFTIYDEQDRNKMLKRIIKARDLEPKEYLDDLSRHISNAKNENLYPEEYIINFGVKAEFEDLMKDYDRALKSANAFDFDDLLFQTYVLLMSYPKVLERYQDIFKYIHVDEFQDTNKVQFDIIRVLSKKHNNLFVVGDDDQSIYSWRGAKIENILNFKNDYKDAKVYKLEENYRSTQNILDVANNIIKNNESRVSKTLYTEKGEGVKVEYKSYSDETDEAYNIARSIINLTSSGYKYSDFVILMRINATSRSFENVFNSYEIPYRIYGGIKFFDRKEPKDILAYLKLINNANDIESFARIINVPKRGIGETSVANLLKYISSKNYTLNEGIDHIEDAPINSTAKLKIVSFMKDIQEFRNIESKTAIDKLAKMVVDKFEYKKQFNPKDPEDRDRIGNVDETIADIKETIEKNPTFDLGDYLDSITLSTDTDDIQSDGVVTIATIHAVKGLEFKVVFIMGLEDGLLPMRRDYSEFSLEEERRLMYVAVTRAQERLFMSSALTRFRNGQTQYSIKSPFIEEGLPKKREASTYDDNVSAKPIISNMPKETKSKDYSKFTLGAKVKHPSFGVGTIVSVNGSGISMQADVAFEKKGIVTLAIQYAPLDIIEK